MAATTPVYALPYPVPTDPADVPADVQALANRIEAVVGPGGSSGQVPIWDNAAKKWTAGQVASAGISPGAALELLTTGTRRKAAFGSDTVAASGSAVVNRTTTHGLGVVPLAVIITLQVGAQGASGLFLYHQSSTTTTFTVQIVPSGSFSGNYNFNWLAIG